MNYTVAVTSGTRGTGKTTSVASLGIAFADAGTDVLLVDCDSSNPSLAAVLGISAPDATIRDVFEGHATLDEVVHTVPAGVTVVPGSRFGAPDAATVRSLVDAIDGFDLVICDTGHPFSEATTGVFDAANGILVVSTADNAARRNAATVHTSFREHARPLLGTALTRVEGEDPGAEWDCELLATIPESDVIADGVTAVFDSPSDPGVEGYRELARGVYRRLREGHDGTASNSSIWLPQPSDPFITTAVSTGGSDDTGTASDDALEGSDSAGGEGGNFSETAAVTDGGNGPTGDETDSATEADTSTAEREEDDDGGIMLTRRGALAAITAAVGGVSAGILNTRETPRIEAFGYGGTPVSSTESGAASASNNTTSAGSLPTAGINRTEPTNETGTVGDEEGLTGNETETGDAGNTTAPANVTNSTDTDEELAPETEPVLEEDGETEPSPTNGGGGTTGGGSTDDGRSSDSGTETEAGTDDGDGTTDDPLGQTDGQFGSVGYGQGGYGGVA